MPPVVIASFVASLITVVDGVNVCGPESTTEPPGFDSSSHVLVAQRPVSRTLRGDWEAPEALLVSGDYAWRHRLLMSLQLAGVGDKVFLLVRPTTRVTDLPVPPGRIITLANDSPWVRDYGPIQTWESDGQLVWLDAVYTDRPDDDQVPRTLAPIFRANLEALPERLDGGAIASNGRGLCAMTSESFAVTGLESNRLAVEYFMQQLGCRVIALVPALEYEVTRHVDMFLQFTAPDRAMLNAYAEQEAPGDAERMNVAASILREAAAALGQRLTITRVPHPAPHNSIYLSFVNGLQLRKHYLMPMYPWIPPEEIGWIKWALSEALPGKKFIDVRSDDTIAWHGAVHCLILGLSLR